MKSDGDRHGGTPRNTYSNNRQWCLMNGYQVYFRFNYMNGMRLITVFSWPFIQHIEDREAVLNSLAVTNLWSKPGHVGITLHFI